MMDVPTEVLAALTAQLDQWLTSRHESAGKQHELEIFHRLAYDFERDTWLDYYTGWFQKKAAWWPVYEPERIVRFEHVEPHKFERSESIREL